MEKQVNLGVLFRKAMAKSEYQVHQPKKRKKYRTRSGFFRVQKSRNSQCKQGFIWVYRIMDEKPERRLASVDILKLKKKVQNEGHEWCVVDEKQALKTAKETHYLLDTLR